MPADPTYRAFFRNEGPHGSNQSDQGSPRVGTGRSPGEIQGDGHSHHDHRPSAEQALRPCGRPGIHDAGDPKTLAARYQALAEEITAADTALQEILDSYAPLLCDLPGVGPDVASQLLITVGDNRGRIGNEARFAALVGVAPIPASSGKTTRHRLSRGGDRNANRALHQVVLTRMASCPRTKNYVSKRTTEGKSKREIMRCLSNRYWLVWCLLAGWLPALLDVTPAASGPSGCDGAFRLTCPSGGAGAGLSSSDGFIEGRPGCHL